jgi:FKBP-type peptidyl-prolyl cis-trans isomerase
MCEGQVGSATVTVDLSVVERLQFAPELGIKLSTFTKSPTGLYYRDSLVGSGTIAATGNLTETFFTAWLPDGKLLETDEVPPPFLSRLGSGFAIAGFDEGVTGMRVGGIRLVIIPPELGYGAKGAGSVPGDVVLVFRVRLTGVQ